MDNEKYRDAEVFLLRVVKNAPDYSRAWADLVKSQREQNKFEIALNSSNKLIQLDPKIAESYMIRASVEGVAGLSEAAINSYKTSDQISTK